ncbi:MAG: phosphoribosylanthranilate isomerase [Endomicrobiia bacterium]|nr:phosphoribosylanthranilate isomerase [Endomicrobiaceae bacterium]MDD3922291.1 phosphoribosylanthranilate isomerase [Endomicrobiaceae bacterium]MDD5102309.1 phosphoribosylanthranilate isomerase [Endomicrobiaceae bacterium]
MLKVKICGITNYDDALSATNLGADYIGFQLIKESPKKVSDKMLKEVNEKLPPFVLAVGVFSDQDHKTITKIVKKTNLKAVQLNGNETPEFCKALSIALGVKVFKMMKFTNAMSVINLQPFVGNVDFFILDVSQQDEQGNISFSFEAAKEVAKLGVPFFVTGSIACENVKDAMEKANPYGIEADSGIERLQRRKDFDKMSLFIKNVHGLR